MVWFCSAQEVKLIKEATQSDFICLTPGIRPLGAAVGDQASHDASRCVSN